MAERGFPGGSVSGTAVVGGRRHRDERLDELTAEEMTTIIPVDNSEVDDLAYWDNWSPVTRPGRRKSTTSETTQDILLPEGEFDQYSHHEPFDVLGAQVDEYSGQAGTRGERDEFRRIPEAAPRRTRGKHRIAAPPTALRSGRVALVAVAAGAAVAAVAAAMTQIDSSDNAAPANPVAAADTTDGAAAADSGPGIAPSTGSQDTSMYGDQLAVGKQLAAAEAARKAAALLPEYMPPIDFSNPSCAFTSLYAGRWGSFHSGIDLACPLGTPIHAVTDGVVEEAGPASGFGNWVQVKAADGTITMYGHMASSGVLVHKGDIVRAGQVIALVGNEGFSTGPHLHFEVWKNGTTKIDPAPWLAAHGIRLPNYSG